MKKTLALLITLCAAVPLFAQSKTRYLISMRRSPATASIHFVRDAADAVAHNVRTFSSVNFIAADLTDAEAAAMRKSPDVNYISKVVPRSISDEPTGPRLHNIASESRFSRSQTVAYGID